MFGTGSNPHRDALPVDIASWIDTAAALLALPGEPAAVTLPDSVSGWVQAILDPSRYEALLEAAGLWAPLFSLGLMLAVSLLPLPAETVAIVNGMVFGRLGGFVLTLLGALIAASVAFAIGRQLGRPAAARFVPARALGRYDRLVEGGGPMMLLVLRMLPVVPFTVVNYGAALSRLRFSTFLWTATLGMIPPIAAFVLMGSVLRDDPLLGWLLIAGGAVAIAGLGYRLRHWGTSRSETP
ncbi:MAG: TVP38/TMEM64 family protein [Alphaproteobacteria bacterium]|nr:MAG: TVP38/TMEM64 family protein [Alphaproteobacteria bacterium]